MQIIVLLFNGGDSLGHDATEKVDEFLSTIRLSQEVIEAVLEDLLLVGAPALLLKRHDRNIAIHAAGTNLVHGINNCTIPRQPQIHEYYIEV